MSSDLPSFGMSFGLPSEAFRPPTRAIFSTSDLSAFHDSQTYSELITFIRLLNVAVKGKSLRADVEENETTRAIVAALDEADKWVSDFPPLDQPMRFGNKAFRSWHQRLQSESEKMMRAILPERLHAAVPELAPYLGDAFGNQTRIDYGTGHETTFVFWLCCLFKLELLPPAVLPAVVNKVFQRYLQLARKLQQTYRLEPAGSHGVWSLDDYQMLPFFFGAAQLADHPEIRPRSIHDTQVMQTYADDYMYLQSVRFITTMKTGGTFAEYAPILNDVSALPTWTKLNAGMMKLYRGEVVGKFPVIQHFRFGSIMPCTWTPSREDDQGFGSVAPPPGPTGVAPWARSAAAPPVPDGIPTWRAPWAK